MKHSFESIAATFSVAIDEQGEYIRSLQDELNQAAKSRGLDAYPYAMMLAICKAEHHLIRLKLWRARLQSQRFPVIAVKAREQAEKDEARILELVDILHKAYLREQKSLINDRGGSWKEGRPASPSEFLFTFLGIDAPSAIAPYSLPFLFPTCPSV